VLDKLAINLVAIKEAGCCGALSYHLNEQEEGLQFARANIDAWWPHIEAGAEAIVMTASGCGVFVSEYGELLKHDTSYAKKAKKVSQLCKDISEVLATENLSALKVKDTASIAFHPPCSRVKDAHFCCGSAGTYSILQKELSQKLLKRKMDTLKQQQPDMIATANIGCLLHLQSAAGETPVVHWIELLDRALT